MPVFSLPISTPALFPTYLASPLKFRRKSSASSTSSAGATSSAAAPGSLLEPASPSPRAAAQPTLLSGSTSRLRCARCLADLALASQIISKGFTGRHGRAYLVAPASASTTPLPVGPGSASFASSPSSSSPSPSSSPSSSSPSSSPSSSSPWDGGNGPAKRSELPNTFVHRPVPRQLVTGLHTVGDISCAVCGSVLGWKYVAAEEEGQRYKVGKFILEGKRVVNWGAWEDGAEGVAGGVRAGDKIRARFDEDEVEFDSQDEDECEDLFLGVWDAQTAARRRRMKRFGRDA